MNTHEIQVAVSARGSIDRLIKRLKRAYDRRGGVFEVEFMEDYSFRDQVVGMGRDNPITVRQKVHTMVVKMDELSDDWRLLFKNEPVNINARPTHMQDGIRSWNPTLSEKNWAKVTHSGQFEDRCDHCDSGKRGRLVTYTVQSISDPSITKTVGSSCMYEYTNIDPADVEALLSLKGKNMMGVKGERNTRTHPEMTLQDFALIAGVWCHNALDYKKGLGGMFFHHISYAKSNGDKHDLGHWSIEGKFTPVIKDVYGLVGEGCLVGDDALTYDRAPAVHADNFMQYMESLAGLNSFEQNVRNIAKAQVVTRKTANLAGGAISGYIRANRQYAQTQMRALQEANKPKSKWVGEVGKRQSFGECTVMFTRRLENQWGVTTLTRFTDASGNMLVWFRSGNHDDLKVAMKVNLTATVKKHDSYKEDEQTTITRGKVMA